MNIDVDGHSNSSKRYTQVLCESLPHLCIWKGPGMVYKDVTFVVQLSPAFWAMVFCKINVGHQNNSVATWKISVTATYCLCLWKHDPAKVTKKNSAMFSSGSKTWWRGVFWLTAWLSAKIPQRTTNGWRRAICAMIEWPRSCFLTICICVVSVWPRVKQLHQ